MKTILILLVLLLLPFILTLSMSDEQLSDLMKNSIWKEKNTGELVKVTSMTSDNVWYIYIDENNNEIGTPGNVNTLWFLKNFKLKK